jgi:hypothetical protein
MAEVLIRAASVCVGLRIIIGFGMQCHVIKHTINMICAHPELSDKKVIAITEMLRKFKFPKHND